MNKEGAWGSTIGLLVSLCNSGDDEHDFHSHIVASVVSRHKVKHLTVLHRVRVIVDHKLAGDHDDQRSDGRRGRLRVKGGDLVGDLVEG